MKLPTPRQIIVKFCITGDIVKIVKTSIFLKKYLILNKQKYRLETADKQLENRVPSIFSTAPLEDKMP